VVARREWQCPECGLIFRSRYQPEECPGCGEPLADLDEFDLLVDLEEEDEEWIEDDLDEDEDLLSEDEILDEDELYEDDVLGEDVDDEDLAADLDLLDEPDGEKGV